MRSFPTRSVSALAVMALLASVPGCAASAESVSPATPTAQQPERPEELFQSGQAAAKRGDAIRAEQYYALALEHGYDRTKVVHAVVEVCIKSSRLRAALLHAEPYLRDHPDDHELRYLVAALLWALGEDAHARRQLELLVRMNPDSGAAHYLLGVLDGSAEPNDAVSHFERYLELEPKGRRVAEVRGRLAELRLELESPEPAREEAP
jgi:tetratricopeptide (TPR) repeat protein